MTSVESTSWKEAMSGVNKKEQEHAAEGEMKTLLSNNTWKLSDLPSGRKMQVDVQGQVQS